MNAFTIRDLANVDWQLLFVRTYTFVRTLFEVVTKQTVKSAKYLVNSFVDDVYYVYEGSYVPVPARDVKAGLGSAQASYAYSRDTKTVISLAGSTAGHQSYVSNILEAKLLLGDLELYDLSDFFDTTEFISAKNTDFPPILTWLGLWSLESGVFLDQTKKFTLSIEMLDGEKFSFPIWDVQTTFLSKWKAMNTPMTLHRQAEVASQDEEVESVARTTTPVPEAEALGLPAPSEPAERQETTMLASPVAVATPEN